MNETIKSQNSQDVYIDYHKLKKKMDRKNFDKLNRLDRPVTSPKIVGFKELGGTVMRLLSP